MRRTRLRQLVVLADQVFHLDRLIVQRRVFGFQLLGLFQQRVRAAGVADGQCLTRGSQEFVALGFGIGFGRTGRFVVLLRPLNVSARFGGRLHGHGAARRSFRRVVVPGGLARRQGDIGGRVERRWIAGIRAFRKMNVSGQRDCRRRGRSNRQSGSGTGKRRRRCGHRDGRSRGRRRGHHDRGGRGARRGLRCTGLRGTGLVPRSGGRRGVSAGSASGERVLLDRRAVALLGGVRFAASRSEHRTGPLIGGRLRGALLLPIGAGLGRSIAHVERAVLGVLFLGAVNERVGNFEIAFVQRLTSAFEQIIHRGLRSGGIVAERDRGEKNLWQGARSGKCGCRGTQRKDQCSGEEVRRFQPDSP